MSYIHKEKEFSNKGQRRDSKAIGISYVRNNRNVR